MLVPDIYELDFVVVVVDTIVDEDEVDCVVVVVVVPGLSAYSVTGRVDA